MSIAPPSLWSFHGGLHPEDHKQKSRGKPIAAAPLPPELVIPLKQHIGTGARPLVKVGDRVLKGQVIARADGYVSAPVHATSSGTVSAIEDHRVPHPSGLSGPCIVIETDGEDRWGERLLPLENYTSLEPAEIRERVREAGIVGLGGAAFPSAVKLNPGPDAQPHTLILNGAECEPYITCDEALMCERPQDVVTGAQILMHALQVERCLIGIEDNKPAAIAALQAELARTKEEDILVVPVPTIYPAGGEKQLIQVLTGQEVPSGGLPLDVGVLCHNVATAASVYRAVVHGEPLLSRIVTLTGSGLREHRNWEVRIGTPVGQLIARTGGYVEGIQRLIMGGPMMGFALQTDEVPVVKATNCLLGLLPEDVPASGDAMPCIRCGACMDACPVNLMPQMLYWHSQAKEFDRVQEYKLFDCIECGCCSAVCPSHIPLVQYFRFAKTEIWAQEKERKAADLARHRHEFRQLRLQREQQEREAKLAQKRAALAAKKKQEVEQAATDQDPKKAAIQAALERAKARKAKLRQDSGEAAEKADAAKTEAGDSALSEEKKAAILAARERARARKAGQTAGKKQLTPEQEEKIRQARERKAQREQDSGEAPDDDPLAALTPEQQEKIKAAKARRDRKKDH